MNEEKKSIPVVDLFAGPGGLGEGFSAYRDKNDHVPFRIALSIEKDTYAHQTLTMRSFFRQFEPGAIPGEYYEYLRNVKEPEKIKRKRLFDAYPEAADRALKSALHAELGREDVQVIRDRISCSIPKKTEFILLGGPPCQAYSIIGRSRNRGNPKYDATSDKRQKLYVEYLQVLADHHPAVFVMENVKGLLSATLRNQRIFKRILDDLRSPCEAVLREGRTLSDHRRKTRYNLLPLVQSDNGNENDLSRFIICMERYGIPQARHRLFIVGVRSDIGINDINTLNKVRPANVEDVISGLPKVRSGLSREEDSLELWREKVQQISTLPFMNGVERNVDKAVRIKLKDYLARLSSKRLSRGGEFVECTPKSMYRPDWFIDTKLKGICNHTTRPHIYSDLHRYLFASCFAAVEKRSPDLRHFPDELLPNHKNARRSAKDGTFDDRFRVQLHDRPSTTVTSHISKDGHYFIHPDPVQCRSMTVREVARLQTFPDNYFFCGPRTSQYIQVGNAVPPLLATQVAASVFDLFKKVQ